MKKILTLLMVLGMVSIANATVVDVVRNGVGDAGHDGSIGTPLDAGEIIGIKLVLNYNPDPDGYASYDGYFLSSIGFDLKVSSNASLLYAEKSTKTGTVPDVQKHANLTGSYRDDPPVLNNELEFQAVASPEIHPGGVDLMWNLMVKASGSGNSAINVDLILPSKWEGALLFAQFTDGSTGVDPYPEWDYLAQEDYGSLVLYQNAIPEPMTIALLGLGGLGLMYRRRRT
jgi:hypothetical protein